MQAVTFAALGGNARSHDLAQSVGIVRLQVQALFEVLPQRFAPRFGAEDADTELQVFGTDAEFLQSHVRSLPHGRAW